MGAIQSALEDCATSTPAYLKEYIGTPATRARGGSHTTIVYSSVPTADASPAHTGSFRSSPSTRYSGPNLSGLRPGLPLDVNDERYRRKVARERTTRVGGSVYEAPAATASPPVTDIWDEAGAEAAILGPVRVQPLRNGSTDVVRAKASFDDAEEAADVNIEPRMPESNTDASSASLRASVEKLQMEFSQRRLDEKEEAVVEETPEDLAKREEMEVCRQEESKLLKLLNVAVHPLEAKAIEEKSQKMGGAFEKWYLLDADWFREWSAFLKGGERPGRIENGKLVSRSGEAWPGLEAGTSYVAIDEPAWGLLSELYGADAPIVRKTFDIYDYEEEEEDDDEEAEGEAEEEGQSASEACSVPA